jgi:hypothetical protein
MTKDSFTEQVFDFCKEVWKLGLNSNALWIDKHGEQWVAKLFICFDTEGFETKEIRLRLKSRIYASVTIKGEKKLEYYGNIFLPVAKKFYNPSVSDLLKELDSYKPAIEDFEPQENNKLFGNSIYYKKFRSEESCITNSIALYMYSSVSYASDYAEALYNGDIALASGYLIIFKEHSSRIDEEIKRLEGVRSSNDHNEARRKVHSLMYGLVNFRCRLKLCLGINPVFSAELQHVKLELVKYLDKGMKALSDMGIEFSDDLNFNVTSEFTSSWLNYLDNIYNNTAYGLVCAMEVAFSSFNNYARPIGERSFFSYVANLRILHSRIDKVNSISKRLKAKPKSFDDKRLQGMVDSFKRRAEDFGKISFDKNLAGIAKLVSETLNSAKSVLNKKGYRFTIKIQCGG